MKTNNFNRPEPPPSRSARAHPLDLIFKPKRVAIVGASERTGSLGGALMQNVCTGSVEGDIYPVNPKYDTVLGIKAYPHLGAVPEPVDLAVIATPAPTVPGIIAQCVQVGVRGAIILSAGFKEFGPAGAALETQILAEARRGNMRIIGPNCLGVMMPHTGLNATFASVMARPGKVAFLSQSGALCTAVLDWSLRQHVGFSAFISIGSMLDVDWGDLIYYLGDDPHTESILIYMESIGKARSFLSAARKVALSKPIIVIKVGCTDEAARAAASHTGAMTGSDEVFAAAFRRVGALRVTAIEELFDMAEVLSKQPSPTGPCLGIVTNAGGPALLAVDQLITSGGQLAKCSSETLEKLNHLLPPFWSHGNPVDLLDDASPEYYAQALEWLYFDPQVDGLLVILTPQAMTEPAAIAEQLKPFTRLGPKPVLASWMGGAAVEAGNRILNDADIPTFESPDTAARTFYYMWRYGDNLRCIYEPSALPEAPNDIQRAKVESLIAAARASGRTLLSPALAHQILRRYGIPTVKPITATTEERAVQAAEELGFPVALKLRSKTITHKTEVGGVQLDLWNADTVRRAYRSIEASVCQTAGHEHFQGVIVEPMISREKGFEIILGSTMDPQFGPVLLFGTGGQLVEVFKDRALELPPLNAALARRMMEQTRIYQALMAAQDGKPIDLASLERILVRFSTLVLEQPWIREIEINPLFVSSEMVIALDCRIMLHNSTIPEDQLPRPAIRPYPTQYVTTAWLKNGMPVTLRPIRPEDKALMVEFHAALSKQTVYQGFFKKPDYEEWIVHEEWSRICFTDYEQEIALVADYVNMATREHQIMGIGHLTKLHGYNEAKFTVVVRDQWQRQRLGTLLLKHLIQIGRDERLSALRGFVLSENRGMQHLCEQLGFKVYREVGESECEVGLSL